MLIGVIADDFTGASDIANTLAKGVEPEGGLRTAQFPGIPDTPADKEIEAGVVSLKSRTAPVEEAVADGLRALRWLKDQGCRQFIFKYCSTFDSTRRGNIGPVAEALANELGAQKVVFCPAFPTTGRTIYHGHLFVLGKLLNESGMENQPLTPMTDADIRRWLQYQAQEAVGLVSIDAVTQGPEAIATALRNVDERFVIGDAISDEDLLAWGEALKDAQLITGGSGIALGLPKNFVRRASSKRGGSVFTGIAGPAAILAGSCSGATRGQIDVHAKSHPTFAIDVPGVMSGDVTTQTLLDFFETHPGQAPLAYSSGSPDDVRAVQGQFGQEAVAEKLDNLFADTARELVQKSYKRLVVAGGETSGAVAKAVSEALGSPAMSLGPEIDPGVPVLSVGKTEPIALALKSGNFGAPDFFARALKMMEAGK
ncbi:four-carbon acid sugar kinase family protein [Ruegeria sp. SCSIO 43209]|uniref:3-oxo-tetronate kinase n=1 Tax=Ruegeria sp. SCSIO 43209 TaxID=2793010 RepID=UPI001CA840BF|nr:3-oxo-tetronate kinase [Ruegeria sp. SCSIO 43209]UAB89140.1 four-carbon acid sugar kinase family protein [Ruegeria sp. SCSIO 43209]